MSNRGPLALDVLNTRSDVPKRFSALAGATAAGVALAVGELLAALIAPESAPLVQDIADYWAGEAGIDREAVRTPVPGMKGSNRKAAAVAGVRSGVSGTEKEQRSGKAFTHRQGQFLAFISSYTKLHRQGPSELDLRVFFGLTPPSVHSMIVKLHQLGLVSRKPGEPRSVRVTVAKEQLPELEDVAGPPW